MEEQRIFHKSTRINKLVIIGIWVLILVCMIVLNLFLRALADLLGLGQTGLRFLLNFFMIILLGLATVYYLYSSKKITVEIGEDTLTIKKWMSAKMIDFSEISSVSMHQTPIGKRYNFATLSINFTHKEPSLTITNIENPEMLARLIKNRAVAGKQNIKIIS